MAPFLGSLFLLCMMTRPCWGVTDSDVARRFVLNPEPLTWDQASDRCAMLNGTLATIDHMDTIPNFELSGEWTMWVGLKVVPSVNMTWQDGGDVLWSNWKDEPNMNITNMTCTSAVSAFPYSWRPRPCTDLLPSLCQILEGHCHFTVTPRASVTAYNNLIKIDISKEDCLELCRTTQDFDCRSVEVHRSFDVCQLSAESRWSQPRAFGTSDRDWDYYHWTCINGSYSGEHTTESDNNDNSYNNMSTESTPPLSSTSESASTSPLTTTESEGQLVCVVVRQTSDNTSGVIRQEVQELKDLSYVIKQQQKIKKKVTVSDPRVSATYVGSLAVGVSLAVLGVIVIIDLMSLPKHFREMQKHGSLCGRCQKARRKKKSRKAAAARSAEFSDRRLRADAVFIVRSPDQENCPRPPTAHQENLENMCFQREITLVADSVNMADGGNSTDYIAEAGNGSKTLESCLMGDEEKGCASSGLYVDNGVVCDVKNREGAADTYVRNTTIDYDVRNTTCVPSSDVRNMTWEGNIG
ncbi:uncharacterized protein LOC112565125 [Pomacea canaliculata]|uniref:uncharacterized protein LOC112565125 n=1 Tax=Pomacea canaliculata TaxID=400727 RepID=UPI000D7260EE|nr:uncharacterized protein LOC112565125 [Pomacea canaliculata]